MDNDNIRIHSSLSTVSRNAHDTVPRHFGPPGAVDYRTLPGRTPRSDDPNLVFQGMRDREPQRVCPDVKILKGTSYSFKNRQIISRWIRDVAAAFKLRTSTFNLGVQLCDIFMLKNLQSIAVSKCQCVALASIWLAAKFEELDHMVPPAQHLSDVCDRAYPASEIIEMEERVLASLKWRLPHTTATNFLYFFLHVLTHNAGFEAAPIGNRNTSNNNNNNNIMKTAIRKVFLLKPGSEGPSTTASVPSSGPVKSETPDEWIDVSEIIQTARDLCQKSPSNIETTTASVIQKLCVALGHAPNNLIRDGATGQPHVAHTTVLQLLGKSIVLAYKIRPASLFGVPSVAANNNNSTNTKPSTLEEENAIDAVPEGDSGEVRIFLRIDRQDGTFSECRGVSLLRGPNSELLRTVDALTREAFLHVEFLPCQAHEMGLAILVVALVAVSSDTAEVSLLLGMLLRRLKLEATVKSNFIGASQLLCEKAFASGVIGTLNISDVTNASEEEKAAQQKRYVDRTKAVLQSLVALTSGSGQKSTTESTSNSSSSAPEVDL